ncbi:MAG: polyphosphate polymerase domain-containing protein [Rhodospirillales bacterium]|nr:polyphosphate polymerase domain-containing protein [Rhodospirillales bacterium]
MNKLDGFLEKFARYEFKYLLSFARSVDIEEEISHFMTYDGHIHPELENSYIVRSLYFDNDWASNYYQKTDGEMYRRKYHLRTYATSYDPDVPLYLEEKGRTNQRTYKQRVPISYEHLEIFETAALHDQLLGLYPGVDLIEAFVFDSIRKNLKPKVLVDYKRRPYTSEFDMNFRATFDSELRATSTSTLFPDAASNWIEFDAGYKILEIKFHRRIPAWFHRALQAHNLSRISISKFCRGMEVCGLATNLE